MSQNLESEISLLDRYLRSIPANMPGQADTVDYQLSAKTDGLNALKAELSHFWSESFEEQMLKLEAAESASREEHDFWDLYLKTDCNDRELRKLWKKTQAENKRLWKEYHEFQQFREQVWDFLYPETTEATPAPSSPVNIDALPFENQPYKTFEQIFDELLTSHVEELFHQIRATLHIEHLDAETTAKETKQRLMGWQLFDMLAALTEVQEDEELNSELQHRTHDKRLFTPLKDELVECFYHSFG